MDSLKSTADPAPRLYLTEDEVDRLMQAASSVGRHRHRDCTLILIGYRHGLRVRELVNLRWIDIDFSSAQMYVRRIKRGISNHHPIYGDEIRALRKLQRLYPHSGRFLFFSEVGTPLQENSVRAIIRRAGAIAGLPFHCHPHQLRHACGYSLANKGVPLLTIKNYLGHKDVQHTVHYCEMAAGQFEGLWK